MWQRYQKLFHVMSAIMMRFLGPCLPPSLWSEKKVKVKSEKWSIFGPLIFFNLRYIKGGARGNNNIGIKKCTTIFLWVLNFGEVGEILENFQKHPLGESFWKMVSKVIFWKNFTRDFPVKNEVFLSKKPPLLFSKNHKLETIFEKSHRSSVILKILENFSNFSKI